MPSLAMNPTLKPNFRSARSCGFRQTHYPSGFGVPPATCLIELASKVRCGHEPIYQFGSTSSHLQPSRGNTAAAAECLI